MRCVCMRATTGSAKLGMGGTDDQLILESVKAGNGELKHKGATARMEAPDQVGQIIQRVGPGLNTRHLASQRGKCVGEIESSRL